MHTVIDPTVKHVLALVASPLGVIATEKCSERIALRYDGSGSWTLEIKGPKGKPIALGAPSKNFTASGTDLRRLVVLACALV